MVGAFDDDAANDVPFLVQVYVYGVTPPVIVTVADPVAVEPHGRLPSVNETAVIGLLLTVPDKATFPVVAPVEVIVKLPLAAPAAAEADKRT